MAKQPSSKKKSRITTTPTTRAAQNPISLALVNHVTMDLQGIVLKLGVFVVKITIILWS
jgi:hypothetical protein